VVAALARGERRGAGKPVVSVRSLEHALAFFAEHGIVAKRLVTDNAWIYVKSRDVWQLLTRHQIRRVGTRQCRTIRECSPVSC
jgi:hypothetical protein